MYNVVLLVNGVGRFATVFRSDTLHEKVAKYTAAGWTAYVSRYAFDSYRFAKLAAKGL